MYACFSDLSTINFHRECDALFFQVNIQYLYLNDIADTDHFQRMFDIFVTDLGNVYQTILVYADIYKCTKINYISYSSF